MGMMKQAQAMQAKMAEMQAELDSLMVEGESGGGLVKLTLSAKGALKHRHRPVAAQGRREGNSRGSDRLRPCAGARQGGEA